MITHLSFTVHLLVARLDRSANDTCGAGALTAGFDVPAFRHDRIG
jgi:hypothetical protein